MGVFCLCGIDPTVTLRWNWSLVITDIQVRHRWASVAAMCVFVCERRGENMTDSGVRMTAVLTSHSVNVTHWLACLDLEQNVGENNSDRWGFGSKPEMSLFTRISCQNLILFTDKISTCWKLPHTNTKLLSPNHIIMTANVVNTEVWPWNTVTTVINSGSFFQPSAVFCSYCSFC